MKQKKKYRPLQFAASVVEKEDHVTYFRDAGVIPADTTNRDFLDFILGDEFRSRNYNGPFKKLNKDLFESSWGKRTLAEIFDRIEKLYPGMRDSEYLAKLLVVEYRDQLCSGPAIREWAKYKLVYRPDEEFFLALANTENVKIPRDALLHLPTNDIFIDLSDVSVVSPIYGVFVHITDKAQVAMYMVAKNDEADIETDIVYSYYSNLSYNEKGYADKDLSANGDLFAKENIFASFDALNVETGEIVSMGANDKRTQIAIAVYELLLYLYADREKADIAENPVTKRTYRKSSRVENKFSEIQMWDVGIRYGAALRKVKADLKRDARENSQDGKETDGHTADAPIKARKRPRPYLRCAHWQHYHIGPGRKETIIKWIAPVIVNGNKEIPVVIRPISG